MAGILPAPGLVGLSIIMNEMAFLNPVSVQTELISLGPILVDPMVGMSITLDAASKELDGRLTGKVRW